jgi:hypothetical protein
MLMSQPVVPHDAVWKYFRKKDRPKKNMLAILDGGMCEWHVCSNTQQRQML